MASNRWWVISYNSQINYVALKASSVIAPNKIISKYRNNRNINNSHDNKIKQINNSQKWVLIFAGRAVSGMLALVKYSFCYNDECLTWIIARLIA